MSPVSPYPVLPIILVALATMKLSAKLFGIKPAEGKFAPIDGLRGYMAFFVFLHHSCIWFFYTHGYGWSLPPSLLYRHFGPSSVFIFFMITSFLFFSKLLQARAGSIDWIRLYVSRALRILPLYYAVLVLLLVLARTGLVPRHVSWSFLGLSAIYLANVTTLLGVPMQLRSSVVPSS